MENEGKTGGAGNTGPEGMLAVFAGILPWLTIVVGLVQAAALVMDWFFYPDRPLLLPMIVAEAGLPWLVLPLLRFVRRKYMSPGLATELAGLGAFTALLGLFVLIFILLFQVWTWISGGHFNGGIFYFPSLWLAGLWAFLRSGMGPGIIA